LGVSKTASDSEIKRAYLRLVDKWHPDRNPDRTNQRKVKEFEEQFKKIQAAYEVLKDPQKRSNFDKYGTPDPQMGMGASMEDILNGIFGGGMGGSSFSFDIGGGMNGFDMGGGDPFSSAFGGFGGRKASSSSRQYKPAPQKPKSAPLKDNIEISIFECFKGVTKNKYYNRTDARTGGSVSDAVSVTVLPGMKAGSRFTFPAKGNHEPNHEPGELILTLKIAPNPTYEIDDIDIIHTKHISLREALEIRQRKYMITSIDGVKKEILIPETEFLTSKTEKIFPGLGMPNRKASAGGKSRGDMKVRFIVDIPEKLTNEQRESIIRTLM